MFGTGFALMLSIAMDDELRERPEEARWAGIGRGRAMVAMAFAVSHAQSLDRCLDKIATSDSRSCPLAKAMQNDLPMGLVCYDIATAGIFVVCVRI